MSVTVFMNVYTGDGLPFRLNVNGTAETEAGTLVRTPESDDRFLFGKAIKMPTIIELRPFIIPQPSTQ